MAEQRYRKPQVAGSTPVTSSNTNATLFRVVFVLELVTDRRDCFKLQNKEEIF